MEKEPQPFRFEDMKFEKVGEKVSLKTVNGTNTTLLNCKFEKGCIIPNHHAVHVMPFYVTQLSYEPQPYFYNEICLA